MNKLQGLKPARVFEYFEAITQIPRCSFEEDQIADYLESFAKDHQLEVLRDAHNNVVIKKPGTAGYEDKEPLIIQGHMDMVCEKEKTCSIDFSKDAIPVQVEGDLVFSKETTLGADNGIAVAMGLAILDADDLAHPPLELLVTSNEESGMTGAKNLDGSMLTGKRLLNLDSEQEGVACIACAAGRRDTLTYQKTTQSPEGEVFYELSITGLKGGHSGQEINKGLGNSNVLLGRALYELKDKVELAYIEGGAKPNAIPRDARAIITLREAEVIGVQKQIIALNRDFVKELGNVDPDVRLNLEKAQSVETVFTEDVKCHIIQALRLLPNGVQSMSHDIEGLVGASVNVGVIETHDDIVVITTNIRSALQSLKEEISMRNRIIAALTGGRYEIITDYPAWEYTEHSPIRDAVVSTYRELYGKDIELEAIHAGLECGIFKESIGDIDMISIGPNIRGAHAPGENLSISSTERVYNFVIELLKNL
ncbi:aminoacyl-histidine dipeptidase [Peptoniphilus equinus]|uniref:Aminoacyl-histidine dipeptidase n=1 Tax=Peptoniphilus equinus TaxID=3016343 RepID=A0ABY7QVB5_9FIRM|nr:aminoacyl-histidine dipeptidase [Peptoniphilus equinus]WBW50733.1 aminoacyl-histidine dipeptidase [Peptoniphilus equinus]